MKTLKPLLVVLMMLLLPMGALASPPRTTPAAGAAARETPTPSRSVAPAPAAAGRAVANAPASEQPRMHHISLGFGRQLQWKSEKATDPSGGSATRRTFVLLGRPSEEGTRSVRALTIESNKGNSGKSRDITYESARPNGTDNPSTRQFHYGRVENRDASGQPARVERKLEYNTARTNPRTGDETERGWSRITTRELQGASGEIKSRTTVNRVDKAVTSGTTGYGVETRKTTVNKQVTNDATGDSVQQRIVATRLKDTRGNNDRNSWQTTIRTNGATGERTVSEGPGPTRQPKQLSLFPEKRGEQQEAPRKQQMEFPFVKESAGEPTAPVPASPAPSAATASSPK